MPNSFDAAGEIPGQLASTTPAIDLNSNALQSRMVIQGIQDDIKNIRMDIKEIRSDMASVKSNIHENFVRILMLYGAGFVALSVGFIYAYNRLDDKITRDIDNIRNSISIIDGNFRKNEILSTKIDTKLEDLLQRIPPVRQVPSDGAAGSLK